MEGVELRACSLSLWLMLFERDVRLFSYPSLFFLFLFCFFGGSPGAEASRLLKFLAPIGGKREAGIGEGFPLDVDDVSLLIVVYSVLFRSLFPIPLFFLFLCRFFGGSAQRWPPVR